MLVQQLHRRSHRVHSAGTVEHLKCKLVHTFTFYEKQGPHSKNSGEAQQVTESGKHNLRLREACDVSHCVIIYYTQQSAEALCENLSALLLHPYQLINGLDYLTISKQEHLYQAAAVTQVSDTCRSLQVTAAERDPTKS